MAEELPAVRVLGRALVIQQRAGMMSAERRPGSGTRLVRAHAAASQEIGGRVRPCAPSRWRKGVVLRKGRTVRAGNAVIPEVGAV